MNTTLRRLFLASCFTLLGACSDSSDNTTPSATSATELFAASIRRTEYGIPHIQAEDWGSLGYGFGYAYSQDNFCILMKEIVIASGRTAELMGEGDSDIEQDLFWVYLNGSRETFYNETIVNVPQRVQDLTGGFAQGVNRYLKDTGAENLAEGCRNQPWVFEIDEFDLFRHLRRIALEGSSDQGLIRQALQSVTAPDASSTVESLERISPSEGEGLRQLGAMLNPDDRGSNAIVAGRNATQTGSSVLLGNPHQGWGERRGRVYQAHLTIPGEYDVAGGTLQGLPFLAFGFSRDVAWTHTVDFAGRFTLYELKLNPDNPFEYEYEGTMRPIVGETVSALVRTDSGALETREKTFYRSHFGMILDLGGIEPLLGGWPIFNGNLLTIRDANLLTGLRTPEEFLNKSMAVNMAEYEAALVNMGNPAFHEIAADRHGEIFYGQTSATPHVTAAKLEACGDGPAGTGTPVSGLIADLTSNVILGLDGSRSACEWGEDPDSPPGTNVFGLANRAVIRGGGTAANANDSYWLSDPDNPLTGFPIIMGWRSPEGSQQTLRTRITHQMVADRLTGADELSASPKFDLDTMKALMYANRVYGAEIALDDTLEICETFATLPPADVTDDQLTILDRACAVLAAWDRRVNLDSRGAQVFTEYWRELRSVIGVDQFQPVLNNPTFWLVDFDPNEPITTPRHIDQSVPENSELVGRALIAAGERLIENNVPFEAPWRDVQFLERNGVPFPIHGGNGQTGVFGAITVSLSEGGYRNPASGNSYIQVVTWDESECPIADVILTHSQSSDPASPHYGDQTRLYADKRWIRYPFCEADIVAAQIGETLVLEGPRVFPGRPDAAN
ncbi:MAG: penicillin acylase family protein [Pseudomonadota bacterium]